MYKKVTFLPVFITILLLFWLASGCAPTYVPNALHTPLLYEKGEVEFNVHTGTNMVDAQVAVAVTENAQKKGGFAVMGNISASNREKKNGAGEITSKDKHFYGEGAVGHYWRLGEGAVVEAYGGYGAGNASAVGSYTFGSSTNIINAEGDLQRFFVQGDIGASTRFFEGGFATRISHVRFPTYMEDGVAIDNVSGTFFEPALFLRFGGGGSSKKSPNIKASMQFGLNIPFDKDVPFDFNIINLAVGVSVHLNRAYLKDRMRDIRK